MGIYLSTKHLTYTNTHPTQRKALTESPSDNETPQIATKQPKKNSNPET